MKIFVGLYFSFSECKYNLFFVSLQLQDPLFRLTSRNIITKRYEANNSGNHFSFNAFCPCTILTARQDSETNRNSIDTVANNDDDGIAAYSVTTSADNDAVGYDAALAATSDQTDMTLQAQLQEYLKQNGYE